MSRKSNHEVRTALNLMMKAANDMCYASTKLRLSGDNTTADKLDKVRDDFRTIWLDVDKKLNEKNQ